MSGRAVREYQAGQRRVKAMELFSQLVRQSVHVLGQVVVDTRNLAQLDDKRVIDTPLLEARSVGAQRVGQHERIAPVVLRARDGVTVAWGRLFVGADRRVESTRCVLSVPQAAGWTGTAVRPSRQSRSAGAQRSRW